MTAYLVSPLTTVGDLRALAAGAARHRAGDSDELVVLDADGRPIELPAGARLALPVRLRKTVEAPEVAPEPKRQIGRRPGARRRR